MYKINKKIFGYIIGAVLGSLAGLFLYFVQPIQWKGTVLVGIGLIQKGEFETLPTVVARINSRSFTESVAKAAKRDEISALLNSDEGAGMSVKPTRGANSLEIIIIGSSAELVEIAIKNVTSQLIEKHDAIIKMRESDIRKELVSLESEVETLSKRMIAADQRQTKGEEAVTVLNTLATQNLFEIKSQRVSILRDSISSQNSHPTSVLGQHSISERRLFPSLWRLILLSSLIGVILSVMWIRSRKLEG